MTRKDIYLAILNGEEHALPTPVTREDYYLAYLCGDKTVPLENLPTPVSRTDLMLHSLCQTPPTGGGGLKGMIGGQLYKFTKL